ncbi:hypothetical protein BU14_1234s0005 [Porphyra umbilicalis]|uniref:Fanconi-associated nuclease n=1 Tax=Porphyra umbilicalis TaxID=2786 RepID=A0A1X6NM85_PORUM|nr:hypothetical protein BU14_1234s0005 [Porphyra umbilicalis]|eukprot:OSX69734.1 hypothetical protein BU14_1234s0005 [Porphyra umbilicalis]
MAAAVTGGAAAAIAPQPASPPAAHATPAPNSASPPTSLVHCSLPLASAPLASRDSPPSLIAPRIVPHLPSRGDAAGTPEVVVVDDDDAVPGILLGPDGKPLLKSYYLASMDTVVATAASQHSAALSAGERSLAARWVELSEPPRRLFARLYRRSAASVGGVTREATLSYPELDIPASSAALVASGLAERLQWPAAAAALSALRLDELRAVARRVLPDGPLVAVLGRPMLVRRLLDVLPPPPPGGSVRVGPLPPPPSPSSSDGAAGGADVASSAAPSPSPASSSARRRPRKRLVQATLDGSSTAERLARALTRAVGPSLRLSVGAVATYRRLGALFSHGSGGGDADGSAAMMAEAGMVTYAAYAVRPVTPLFPDRTCLLLYEWARALSADIDAALAVRAYGTAAALGGLAEEELRRFWEPSGWGEGWEAEAGADEGGGVDTVEDDSVNGGGLEGEESPLPLPRTSGSLTGVGDQGGSVVDADDDDNFGITPVRKGGTASPPHPASLPSRGEPSAPAAPAPPPPTSSPATPPLPDPTPHWTPALRTQLAHPFLRRYSYLWALAGAAWHSVAPLERGGNHAAAVARLRLLLATPLSSGRRRKWAARLALNLDRHLRRPRSALSVCLTSLAEAGGGMGVGFWARGAGTWPKWLAVVAGCSCCSLGATGCRWWSTDVLEGEERTVVRFLCRRRPSSCRAPSSRSRELERGRTTRPLSPVRRPR